MAYDGISTRNGTCAICGKDFPTGTHVYFDPTKRQGNHLVHSTCWVELQAKRGRRPLAKKGSASKPVQSTEVLDPPF